MPSSAPGRETCSPPAKRHYSRSPMSTLSRGFPSMSASCSRRFRIRCACSAALFWWAAVPGTPLAAQQLDEAQIGELAHLLAAADARNFDAALVSTGLRDADERAPVSAVAGYVDDVDPTVRWRALYSLGRLRVRQGAPLLVSGLQDPDPRVRASAARGITRQLLDSAHVAWRGVADQLRPLLSDTNPAVRVNALRALTSFHDSGLAQAVIPLLNDPLVNVAVQAETTLGVLGGSGSVAALEGRVQAAAFALRRQAVIALAQADSAAGVRAADALLAEADWNWRSVAAEAFGAAQDRTRLQAQLSDPDGRVVAQALQTLGRIVPPEDTAALSRARALLEAADPAVRSVAADLLARRAAVGDIDRLVRAYARAAGD